MSGFIKLHRQIVHSDLWLEEPFTRGQAFADLILLANYKDGYLRVNGQRIKVKRGQVGWSLNKIADRWQWSRGKVSRFLNELVEDQAIFLQTDNKKTIITICNYSKYQDKKEEDGQETDNGRTTDGQETDQTRTADGPQTDPNKEVKEVKEIYVLTCAKIQKQMLLKMTEQDFVQWLSGMNKAGKSDQMIFDAINKLQTAGKMPSQITTQMIERELSHDYTDNTGEKKTNALNFELTDEMKTWANEYTNDKGMVISNPASVLNSFQSHHAQKKTVASNDEWFLHWRGWITGGIEKGFIVTHEYQKPQERQKRIGA